MPPEPGVNDRKVYTILLILSPSILLLPLLLVLVSLLTDHPWRGRVAKLSLFSFLYFVLDVYANCISGILFGSNHELASTAEVSFWQDGLIVFWIANLAAVAIALGIIGKGPWFRERKRVLND
jgi:hypothetical protein